MKRKYVLTFILLGLFCAAAIWCVAAGIIAGWEKPLSFREKMQVTMWPTICMIVFGAMVVWQTHRISK